MTTWKNKDLVKFGWTKTKENLWPLVALMALVYFVGIFAREIRIGFVVDILTSFVLTSVFLRIAKGEKFDFKKVFDCLSGPKFLHYVVGVCLATIFVIAGLGLLVVPGIIVGLMLSFVGYILVEGDNKMPWKSWKFWEAIKKSYFMTKGHKWRLFTFLLVIVGINILGLLALFVGLLFTVPLTGIAMTALYEKLKNKNDSRQTSNIPSTLPSE